MARSPSGPGKSSPDARAVASPCWAPTCSAAVAAPIAPKPLTSLLVPIRAANLDHKEYVALLGLGVLVGLALTTDESTELTGARSPSQFQQIATAARVRRQMAAGRHAYVERGCDIRTRACTRTRLANSARKLGSARRCRVVVEGRHKPPAGGMSQLGRRRHGTRSPLRRADSAARARANYQIPSRLATEPQTVTPVKP